MIRMNILLNLFAIVLYISTTKSLFLNKLIPSQSSLISDITKQKYLHTTNLNLNNINDELLLDKIVYLRFDGNSNKRLGSAGFIARLEFVESENSTTSLDLFQGFSWLGTEITSHAAEYWALIKALLYFQAYQHQYLLCLNQKYHLEIQGDSQVLINYLTARNQIYKLRDRKLSILHQYTQCLLQSLNMTVSFQYIPRENNSIADSLARSASISRTSQVSFHPNETTLVLIRAQCNRKYIREVNKLNLCLQFDGSLPMNIINSYLYDLDSLETSNSSDNKKVSNVFPLYIPKSIETIDIHTSLNLSNCNHEVSSKVDLLSSSEIAFVNANRLFINNEELFHSEYLYINGYDKNCTTNILNAIISPQLFDDQLFYLDHIHMLREYLCIDLDTSVEASSDSKGLSLLHRIILLGNTKALKILLNVANGYYINKSKQDNHILQDALNTNQDSNAIMKMKSTLRVYSSWLKA